MTVTFAEIEEKLVALLKSKGLAATEADLPSVLACKTSPSFHCRIASFKCENVVMRKFKIVPAISVYLALKNVSIEKNRRQSIYPLIQGIIGILAFQDLGLSIAPLRIQSGQELILPEFADSGIILYQIDLVTGFTCDMSDEKTMTMLRMNLEYYLKPGDTVADAVDIPVPEED
jgi:hypothetical protein